MKTTDVLGNTSAGVTTTGGGGGPSQEITSFITSSFYGRRNTNKTTANIPLVDLANEIVTVTPEFDNTSVDSDYFPSNNSEISDSDWELPSNITTKVSGIKRRCSQTKKLFLKRKRFLMLKKGVPIIRVLLLKAWQGHGGDQKKK